MRFRFKFLLHSLFLTCILLPANAQDPPAVQAAPFPAPLHAGPQGVKRTIDYTPPTIDKLTCSKAGRPKTVILLIGDGMGPTHSYLGKIAGAGVRAKSHLELCDYLALANTFAADSPITDSAAGGTALASGEKTNNETIGQTPDGKPLPTLITEAQRLGKRTGIVTSDSVTGATPACFYAHAGSRTNQDEIASQLPGSKVDFFIAGGRDVFTKAQPDGSTLQARSEKAGYRFITTMKDLREATLKDAKILGLLTGGSILNRTEEGRLGVAEMTRIAIEKLSGSKNGFFLMVEGARIDKESHKSDGARLVDEAVDFDLAVGAALAYAEKERNVLVVVTADHETGGLSVPVVREQQQEYTIAFSSEDHTGVPVIVAAGGLGSPAFHGFIDNTDVPKIIKSVWK